MEEDLSFNNGNIRLEGRLDQKEGNKGVVITHPHPLYGGNMNTPVVGEMVKVFARKNYTTLRFNFRGTGKSTGMFDNGNGETDDVRSALAHLKSLGVQDLTLAGYSFGARVNAAVVASGEKVSDHLMISPPVAFMSFDTIKTMPSTGLVVTGSRDDIAPETQVREQLAKWDCQAQFKVIPDCDHFYGGCLQTLNDLLLNYLS